MKKRLKYFIKIFLCGTFCVAVLQCVRFLIESKMIVTGVIKEESNCKLYEQSNEVGNCVVIHKDNGLSTYPFLFGNRLYLYDIDNNKSQLVAITFKPFWKMEYNVSIVEDTLYYEMEGPIEASEYYCQKIGSWKRIRLDKDDELRYLYNGYSVYKNMLYYWGTDNPVLEEKSEYSYDQIGEIHAMNWEANQLQKVTDSNVGYLAIDNGELYYHDVENQKIVIQNIETSEKREIPWEREIIDLVSNERELFVLDYAYEKKSDIWLAKLETVDMKAEEIVSEVFIEDCPENLKYRDEKIYYNVGMMPNAVIYQYDVKSGSIKKVIDTSADLPFRLKDEYESRVWSCITYCEDYIVVEFTYYSDYEINNSSMLLIYDYDGQLVQKKKLF